MTMKSFGMKSACAQLRRDKGSIFQPGGMLAMLFHTSSFREETLFWEGTFLNTF